MLNLTTTRPSDQAAIQNSTYGYDSVGNIQTITDSLLGPQTQTFQYDSLNRLTNITQQKGSSMIASYAYTLDAVGNRLA